MTPGLPGTGIGGLFYLISAIVMPIRGLRDAARSGRFRLKSALFQFGLAATIIAALWFAGWLLGLILIRPESGTVPAQATTGPGAMVNIFHIVAIAGTLGLLAIVLLTVQLLRCLFGLRKGPRNPTDSRPLFSLRRLAALFFVGAISAGPAMLFGLDIDPQVRSLLSRADSAFNAGNLAEAQRLYRAVLDADPSNSRAVFQAARIMAKGSKEQMVLYQRYIDLEPSDPWGYMALGDAMAEAGELHNARREYERALKLSPSEPDVRFGLERILIKANRLDEAIGLCRSWTAESPENAAAWRELGRLQQQAGRFSEAAKALKHSLALQNDAETARMLGVARSKSSPTLTPFAARSSDSDHNTIGRVGVMGDWQAGVPLRLGFTATRTTVEDDLSAAGAQEIGATLDWRPQPGFQLRSMTGITRMDSRESGQGPRITPVIDFRARWRSSADGPSIEFRGTRSPILATPQLVAQPVMIEELRGKVETSIHGPVRLRLLGRAGLLDAEQERNTRTGYGGGIVLKLGRDAEISTVYQRLAYARPSSAGYFAPRAVQTVETGVYLERDFERVPISVAFDAGAGGQQISEHGAGSARWGHAFHAWGLIGWKFQRNLRLGIEVEASQSQVAFAGFAPSSNWRYASAMLSLRWALTH